MWIFTSQKKSCYRYQVKQVAIGNIIKEKLKINTSLMMQKTEIIISIPEIHIRWYEYSSTKTDWIWRWSYQFWAQTSYFLVLNVWKIYVALWISKEIQGWWRSTSYKLFITKVQPNCPESNVLTQIMGVSK